MKRFFKELGAMLLIIVVCAVLGMAALTVVLCIPVNEENVSSSYALLSEEANYPSVLTLSNDLDVNGYFHSYLPGVLDNGTDGLMLDSASVSNDGHPFQAAASMLGYNYYWHGYVVILRLLLCVMDLEEIRILNMTVQMALAGILAVFVYSRKRQWRYVLAILTSYALLFPAAVGMGLQFSWVFYVAAGATGLLLCSIDQMSPRRWTLIFLMAGILTSYLDLLTYPLFTWGIPILLWMMLQSDRQRISDYVQMVVRSALVWILGYALMWVMKWALASLILDVNVFESAIYEVGFRSGVEEALTLSDRFNAIYVNWKHYEYKIYAFLLGCWLLWGGTHSVFGGWKTGKKLPAYLLAGSSGAVWYIVLVNHTTLHHFFTYRIASVSVLAFLLILCECTQKYEGKLSPGRLVRWGICGVVSGALSFLPRETLTVTNGMMEITNTVELSDGQELVYTFVPTYGEIDSYGICLETADTEGSVSLNIVRDGETLYRETITLKNLSVITLQDTDVDWKLQKGETYEIHLIPDTANGESVSVLLSEEAELDEYSGTVQIGNENCSGQPLSMLTYSRYPFSRRTLLWLALTWMGVLGTAGIALYSIVQEKKADKSPVKTMR